jgi:hypothetical protein
MLFVRGHSAPAVRVAISRIQNASGFLTDGKRKRGPNQTRKDARPLPEKALDQAMDRAVWRLRR